MHSEQVWEQAVALRKQGKSLNEISRELGISKGTASLWLRDVEVPPEGQARLQGRIRIGQEALRHAAKKFVRRRQEAYERGLASVPTVGDALCIGLYWGEGSKAGQTWCFSNSEREMIAAMTQWCIRAGQAPGAFRAHVHVHPEDTVSDDEVRLYWSEAGIPIENIRVYRFRSQNSHQRHQSRIPYGTCHLHPLRAAATLFEYYRGQRDALLLPDPRP